MNLGRVQALKLPYRDHSYYALGSRHGLFLSNWPHHIFRVDPDDYRVSWELPWAGIRSKTLVGDMLIISDRDDVHGVNAETGDTRWKHKANRAAEHGQGRLILYPLSGGYLVVDAQTGDVERRLSPPSFQGYVVRTLPDCTILQGKAEDGQTFHAFDFEAQEVRWEFSPRRHLNFTGSDHISPTVVGASPDASILLLELDRHLIAVRVSDGVVIWQHEHAGTHTNHRTCAGLTFLLEKRDLVCLDIASGDIAWRMAPPSHGYASFSLACDGLYRDLLVLSDGLSISLASPQDGTIHASYTDRAVSRVAAWDEGLIAITSKQRVDLLAAREESTEQSSEQSAPKRRPARAIALRTPSSVEHKQRAEQRRASRRSPPKPAPVPTIEVIASIPTGTSRTPVMPTPVVGPNGVFFVLRENDGTYAGIRKLARSTYEKVWETPPSEVAPAWATDAHLVCGDDRTDRVEVLDVADGRSLWSTESQRGESWAWRDLIVTSPDEPAEIRLLDPATGRCERTIQRPLEVLCGVSGDLALICAARHEWAAWIGATLRVPIDPFAVVDLGTGRVKWQRGIFERLTSEHEPHRDAEVFAVGPTTAVVSTGDHLAGVDLTTGDLVWQMSLVNHGRRMGVRHVANNRIWMTGENGSVRIVRADTGEVTDIEGRGGRLSPYQTWGDYGISFSKGFLDMYHPNGTSMRLKLRNDVCAAVEASPDLILVERKRLRVVRQGRIVFV
jgi:outer membrane protein assembly factor BamB